MAGISGQKRQKKRIQKWAGGTNTFFAELSIEELAKAQKVKPFNDLSDLAGGLPKDLDLDEFLQEIYASRR